MRRSIRGRKCDALHFIEGAEEPRFDSQFHANGEASFFPYNSGLAEDEELVAGVAKYGGYGLDAATIIAATAAADPEDQEEAFWVATFDTVVGDAIGAAAAGTGPAAPLIGYEVKEQTGKPSVICKELSPSKAVTDADNNQINQTVQQTGDNNPIDTEGFSRVGG